MTFDLPSLRSGRLLHLLLQWTRALAELIAELLVNVLEVLHSARSGCLPPLGLHAPVEVTNPRTGIAALGASRLLDMVRRATAPPAQRVGLIMALSKAGCSFRHDGIRGVAFYPKSLISVPFTSPKILI